MTTVARAYSSASHRRMTLAARAVAKRAGTFVLQKDLDESLEDARLNAIADERAAGPFVRVSLDDL